MIPQKTITMPRTRNTKALASLAVITTLAWYEDTLRKIPEMMYYWYTVSFSLGGTSILIVVSVTMDTVAQIQGYLLAHQYEGLIKRSKLRGRNR